MVDLFVFGPNRGIEAGRQAGFELLRRPTGDAVRASLANGDICAACLRVPISIAGGIAIALTHSSGKTADFGIVGYGTRRIGR